MTIQYLYLDDEDPHETEPYARGIERAVEGIRIRVMKPRDFTDQLNDIDSQNINGLILDLRLDIIAPEGQDRVIYRAPALAQELRTRAAEGGSEYPIVLWSTQQLLQESYSPDITSHDLFDDIVEKIDLKNSDRRVEHGRILISLAEGYKGIGEVKTKGDVPNILHLLLGFTDQESSEFLPDELLEVFDIDQPQPTVHRYARFLLRDLITIEGPLIPLSVVAARLGINTEASRDFPQLMDRYFADYRYIGVFGDGWPRWWASLVETQWRSLMEQHELYRGKSLRLLKSEERVKALKDVTGLQDLVHASPIADTYRSTYWTICQETKRPLDPKDGFLLKRRGRPPWANERFVSFEGMMTNPALKSSDLDPIDRANYRRAVEQTLAEAQQ